MTATSRQNVTTVLSFLKKQNILSYDRRKIVVKEIKKL
ncbi:MAG: winged helix-turn-helix domain-containing protein [Segetibacter sp.]|jgi:uncharacterized protein Smg (DUF494 family)|nr:winged helix-turn-helix domain-containing protein [Segetibacter sp.]